MAPQVHRGRRGPAGAAAAPAVRSTTPTSRRPSSTVGDARSGHGIHMPSPSFYPLVLALGLPVPRLRRGVHNLWLAIPGLLLLLFGIYAWGLEPGDRGRRRWRRSSRSPSTAHRAAVAAGARRRRRPRRRTHEHAHDTHTGRHQRQARRCGCSCRPTASSSARSSRRTCSTATAPGRRARRPQDVFNIPFTSVTSFILLMSSLTMVLALAAIQRGDHRRFRIWIMATALFGATFIGGQIFEFTEFTREGLQPRHQPVRLELLRAHRLPRRARHDRHRLAGLAVGPLDAGPPRAGATPSASRSPGSTGTSSTWCGS